MSCSGLWPCVLGLSGVCQPGVYFWAWTCQGYRVSLGIVTAGDERESPSSLFQWKAAGCAQPFMRHQRVLSLVATGPRFAGRLIFLLGKTRVSRQRLVGCGCWDGWGCDLGDPKKHLGAPKNLPWGAQKRLRGVKNHLGGPQRYLGVPRSHLGGS